MPTSPDSPDRPSGRLDATGVTAAIGAIALGAFVLVGWHAHVPTLVQVIPGQVAMQYNTALGFVLLGTSMLASARGARKFASVLAVVIGVGAVLTLSQDLGGWKLGIDEALFTHDIRVATSEPGRMAPATALCFALLSGALAMVSTRRRRWAAWHLAVPAALVVALAGTALFGYATNLIGTYGWSTYTRMAVHTASGMLVLGLALLRSAWLESLREESALPRWVPAGALLGGVVASLVLGYGLMSKQDMDVVRTSAVVAASVQRQIADGVSVRVRSLERMAARWGRAGGIEPAAWASDAEAYVRDFPGFQAIEWVDGELVIRRAVPLEGNEQVLGLNLNREERRSRAIDAARASGKTVFTRPVDLAQGGRGLIFYVPVISGGLDFHGFIVGVLRVEDFFRAVLPAEVAPGYEIAIDEDGTPLFTRASVDAEVARVGVVEHPLEVYGAMWTVRLTPSSAPVGGLRSPLPLVTLLAGVAASGVLGYQLRLSRRRQRSTREVSLVNEQLGREIDERVRIEARVQAALAEVERQKFALDEHAIVSMTDVHGTITYANDRLCAISGYSREELIGANHRIVRSGMHPQEYFAEMYRTIALGRVWKGEICNRTKDGRPYWVAATIVPFMGPDGRPEQYVAIRTDITARKDAERKLTEALRLSEASLEVTSHVAGSAAMRDGDVPALARLVTEAAASAIDVARVGVWMFDANNTTLTCLDLFERPQAHHLAGLVLHRGQFEPEFAALVSSRYIDAHDALSDPRTAGYVEGYLRPHGITSVLDVVIRMGGRMLGLLGFEHVGRTHHWEPREIAFGCQLADQIGIAILTRERQLAAEELVRARDAAEAATRAKSDFLAMMSHEIRTPINGVLGMNNLMLETALGARQRQIATSINTSAESLLTIVNDILDFSKIEARKLELEHVAFDLRTVLEEALEIQATRAHAKGLELAGLLDPAVEPLVRGDPGRVRQVLCNLIGNAVKFTERGEVVVRATVAAETGADLCMRFEVRDTGIGISTEGRQRLFQAFSQAEKSTTRRFGGTGLGLVISRQLVGMMGGEIGVSSEPGRGSTFHFTVRLERQPAAARGFSLAPERAVATGRRRVLVVEDNASCRALLCEQLQAWQINPERANSAREALERLRQAAVMGARFETVLVDLGLPGIDGLALASDIGRDPLLSGSHVVLLVPLGSSRDIATVDGVHLVCVAKPVRSAELLRAMENRWPAAPGMAAAIETADEPGCGVRVLLAEDNAINQMVAVANLNKLGCTTDVAGNGLEVLEALRRAPYDLVFMDCMMPEMDGFEATQRIRAGETTDGRPPVHIVALTANAMVGDREKCMAAGMNDYISKPMRAADVRTALQRWRDSARQAAATTRA